MFNYFGIDVAEARRATEAGKDYVIDSNVQERCEFSERAEKILNVFLPSVSLL